MKKIVMILVCLMLFCHSFGFAGFAQDYEIYVVQPKDTWGIIAAKYKIPMDELVKMNNRDIKNLIFVGEGIKVPLLKSSLQISQENVVEKAIKDLQQEPLEKERDTISFRKIFHFAAIILSIIVFAYILIYFLKQRQILTLSFQDGRVFEIRRQLVNKEYICPVCKIFKSSDRYTMIRHLKGEYKEAKRINNEKNLKLFKKKEV